MYELELPDLGEGVGEGEILHWHVEPGDAVGEGDPLVEIETDKAAVTIPAPRAGRVVSVSGAVGARVAVGTLLAVIDDDGAAAAAPASEVAAVVELVRAPVAEAEEESPAATRARAEGPIPAAPATRRMARELGVDLHDVPASGPAGRVTADDVQRFAAPALPAALASGAEPEATPVRAAVDPGPPSSIPFFKLEPLPDFSQWGAVKREPMRSIRRKVAYRMTTSAVVVPHVVHLDEADVTDLEQLRRQQRALREGQAGGRLTLLAFVVKAVSAQLKARPQFNASIDPFAEEVVYKTFVNIGFAADTDRGLVVPVVPDADRKSILELSAEIEDKALRAREGKLEVAELRGGTFTITNVGSLGGTGIIPTINYPEVAILGLGRAQERPVVREGQVVVRRLLPLTLVYDHRIIDGAEAARFVSALVRTLADPSVLLIEC